MSEDPNQSAGPRHSDLDALLPADMARKCEAVGENKAKMTVESTFVLAVLAGAFIGLGGALYVVVVTSGDTTMAYGLSRLLGGLAFSLGLILIIVGGAELFTGNNLIVMAWASRRISSGSLLRNWLVVYLGNFVGAIGIACLMWLAGLHKHHQGAVGDTIVTIAQYKCDLSWSQAFFAGIGCNLLVCLAVWLCMSARTVTDKVLAIIFPITAFVATGMEHSIANMYFIPMGMLVETQSTQTISASSFLFTNLVPVTLGNIFGGAVLVGLIYWFVYLKGVDFSNG